MVPFPPTIIFTHKRFYEDRCCLVYSKGFYNLITLQILYDNLPCFINLFYRPSKARFCWKIRAGERVQDIYQKLSEPMKMFSWATCLYNDCFNRIAVLADLFINSKCKVEKGCFYGNHISFSFYAFDKYHYQKHTSPETKHLNFPNISLEEFSNRPLTLAPHPFSRKTARRGAVPANASLPERCQRSYA